MKSLRIATRQSPLALWQAEHVAEALRQRYPELDVVLVPMTTTGDQLLHSPLAQIGGKGLFIKELEQSILRGESDLAVHSMKDVGANLPEGFVLAAILERENPYDALVSSHYASLEALPQGAKVGTCSLRRQLQLKRFRPDVQCFNLRGNVQSRLDKLDAGEFDAIILAAAGLIRLGLKSRIRQILQDFIPAVGQGAIGIECRADSPFLSHIQSLNHEQTAFEVRCERRIAQALNASCQVPLAVFAQQKQGQLQMALRLGEVGAADWIALDGCVPMTESERLIDDFIAQLEARGAQAILERLG